jgi:hypothetical protein
LVKLYRGEAGKKSHWLAQRGRKNMQYLIPGLMLAIVIGGALVAMKIGR